MKNVIDSVVSRKRPKSVEDKFRLVKRVKAELLPPASPPKPSPPPALSSLLSPTTPVPGPPPITPVPAPPPTTPVPAPLFLNGDKVFAKIDGYPYWPAVVIFSQYEKKVLKHKYQVSFPNSQTGISLRLEKFTKESAVKFSKQRFKSGCNGIKQFKLDVKKLYESKD